MTSADLTARLHKRMLVEQKKYRDWLLGQPPDKILEHACEYSVREDIITTVWMEELTDPQVKALLKSPTPLADVYKEWNKAETDHMDAVWGVLASRADAVIQAEKEKSQREGR